MSFERPKHLFMRVAIGIHNEKKPIETNIHDEAEVPHYCDTNSLQRRNASSANELLRKASKRCSNAGGGSQNFLEALDLSFICSRQRQLCQRHQWDNEWPYPNEKRSLHDLKNHGKEEQCARNLFGHLISSCKDARCPNECPGLSDVWGEDFNALTTITNAMAKEGKQFALESSSPGSCLLRSDGNSVDSGTLRRRRRVWVWRGAELNVQGNILLRFVKDDGSFDYKELRESH
eukprot:TRINITY_DN14751_c0_g1_i1.p1 TRINITY_DN14751_c0_g1~~TRINITY_DN14751_c0_g1_i1.p1  ORF type:complete len:233 (+),score=15.77 TRINITY_DN14751_c0_g1_i1:129-827(+)